MAHAGAEGCQREREPGAALQGLCGAEAACHRPARACGGRSAAATVPPPLPLVRRSPTGLAGSRGHPRGS